MVRCEHGNFVKACLQCQEHCDSWVPIGDRCDGERFITRENNKVFDRLPVAQVIKEKTEKVLKYPGASDGIFAIY